MVLWVSALKKKREEKVPTTEKGGIPWKFKWRALVNNKEKTFTVKEAVVHGIGGLALERVFWAFRSIQKMPNKGGGAEKKERTDKEK